MTMLTKPAKASKKAEIIKVPLVEVRTEVLPVADRVPRPVRHDWVALRQTSRILMYVAFTLTLMIMVLTTGLLMFRQPSKPQSHVFCRVLFAEDKKLSTPAFATNFHVLPIRWSSEPDVQVLSTLDESTGQEFMNALHEEVDIDENVEKIAVVDNGRRVNFIHDFNDNTTGIVDSDRCFVMELEPELVLEPAALAAGLAAGAAFDVGRVRSALRAALPALSALSARVAAACAPRPVYRLRAEPVHKRSTDNEPHDYIQFSGKYVQEIKINNLQEILDYEKSNKVA